MKKLSIFTLITYLILSLSSCQTEQEAAGVFEHVDTKAEVSSVSNPNRAIALEVVSLLQDESSRNAILNTLEEKRVGVGTKMETLLQGIQATNLPSLRKKVTESTQLGDYIQVPELWLQRSSSDFNSEDVLVAYVPEGDESDWDRIEAFDLNGNVVYLDKDVEPTVPVIVYETKGSEAFSVTIKKMNEMLQAAGLQKVDRKERSAKKIAQNRANGLETSKLDKIRVNNAQESWVLGNAEIYAITSGLRGSNSGEKSIQIQIQDMPYLDDEDKNYYPNQIMLFWDDYDYQAANIQLYEQDSNTSYKDLVVTIVDGVFQIVGTLTTQPWVNALGTVASAILRAMPDSWYTNDDDYVDSFYTIEKNRTYNDHYGAGGNARVNITPYFVPAN